jgi:SecD/SecF fusion protein
VKERRNHLILVGLILVALIGAVALMIPNSPVEREPVLGLDLQGGLEVVLEAVPPPGRPLQKSDLERSKEIIRDRIDKLGVAEPEIRTQGENQISVQLPGVKESRQAQDLIGQTAQLELYDLQPALTGPSVTGSQFQPVPNDSLYDLLVAAETQALVKENGGTRFYLFREQGKKLLAGPLASEEALLGTEAAEEAGDKGTKVLAVPRNTVVITCGDRGDFCPGVGAVAEDTFYYLFRFDPDAQTLDDRFPQMTGEDLRLSGTRQDFDTTTGQPIVLMQFTDEGADRFHDITRAESQRGNTLWNLAGQQGNPENYNQNFAIVLDRELITAPSIDFQDLPDGISGNLGAQITGIDDINEAKEIALVLQTGALPVEFKTQSSTEISATLGEDSLRQALRAALIGMVVVAIFLLIVYRFLGLVAVLGLAVYAVILYAMILLFNVTLTLPGFAGMILTVGVAADANIVIFERIKEEARAGKSVRAAISSGYGKGFATIVDANVVTAITAVILFVLASSGVRGFALMLLMGTAVSIVTAVLATRALLGLLSGFRWFDNPAFMGASPREIPPWQRVDIVGRRRLWFTIASVLIGLAVISIAVKGLNLGIDFRGGTQTTFSSERPVPIEDVRAQADRLGQGNASIQGVGAEVSGGYREFQIKTEDIAPAEQRELVRTIEQNTGAVSEGARTVSASFSGQILRSAVLAMIFAFVLISLYITLRFQWRFAVPILRTIVNDGMIAVGVYSISDREVTASTVAAFLTIIGYSIYDTIIIFDRVRENLGLMRRSTIAQITNVSLWETIPRSLATTFITLLPVSVMFFFGGETLKDFAFAILIGIGVSAFSTIFIAAPFLAVLMERHPEYRGRRVDGAVTKEEAKRLVSEATEAAADEPVPALAPLTPAERATTNAEKRERRRQRRRTRPHGRAR